MHHRIPSSFVYFGTVAAATLAAVLMSGTARAEGPIEDIRPVTGERTRTEVKAELLHRRELARFGGELARQQYTLSQGASTLTREQARAGYIGARDAVRQMNAEDSGSAWLAQRRIRPTMAMSTQAALH